MTTGRLAPQNLVPVRVISPVIVADSAGRCAAGGEFGAAGALIAR